MSKVVLDESLRQQLQQTVDVAELCDRDGRTIAYALTPDEYKRLLYAQAHVEFSKPEVRAEVEASLEAVRRGEYVNSAQLFEELRQLGYMPREGR